MIVADAGGLPTGVVSGRIRLIELISVVLVPARVQQRHAEWTLASALRETLLLIAELLKEMNLPKLHFRFFQSFAFFERLPFLKWHTICIFSKWSYFLKEASFHLFQAS